MTLLLLKRMTTVTTPPITVPKAGVAKFLDRLHQKDLGSFLKIQISGPYLQAILILLNGYNVELVSKPYTGLRIPRDTISQNVKGLYRKDRKCWGSWLTAPPDLLGLVCPE